MINNSVWVVFLVALIDCAFNSNANARDAFNCIISDLNIGATIPNEYTQIPTKCPVVKYKKSLNPNHAVTIHLSETPYPYESNKETPDSAINDYMEILQHTFDKAYKGEDYSTARFDENTGYPKSIINAGGVCRGIEARLPLSYQDRYGVEWRLGIICLVELPSSGPGKWNLIQAFFADMNIESADYKPNVSFKREARELFRSIYIKGR